MSLLLPEIVPCIQSFLRISPMVFGFPAMLLEIIDLFFRELGMLQQIRPVFFRDQKRLPAPPFPDLGMISGKKDLWHLHPFKITRPRILRMFKQAIIKRIRRCRIDGAKDSGDHTGYCVCDHHGRKFPPPSEQNRPAISPHRREDKSGHQSPHNDRR